MANKKSALLPLIPRALSLEDTVTDVKSHEHWKVIVSHTSRINTQHKEDILLKG